MHPLLARAVAIAKENPDCRPRPLHPWRQVVSSVGPLTGRGSVLGRDTARRTAWWELTLDCGHEVERTVRYSPQKRGQPRRYSASIGYGRRTGAGPGAV